MNAEDYEWIGIINPEDVKPGVTFVTPLAYYVEGAWKSIVLDARRQWFPNNGKAAIFAKDFPSAKIGRLWLFHPERNAQLIAPTMHGYSYYLVSSELEPAPLAQVINWTARANHSYELPDLLEQGIAAKDCFCQRVYIYCQSRLYGPIRLDLDSDRFKPREYLQSSTTGGQLLFVWMYTLPEDGVLDLTNVHIQFTFLDERMLDTPTGKEDWSLPQVIIKRILQASNEALADTEDHVHLVDKRLRDLARLSSQDGLFALHLDSVTLKRAQYIVSNQIERLQELHAIFDQLSAEHPLMKAARIWEIQARSNEIEQEAEALIRDKRERLQQLQGKIEEVQARLNPLQDAATEAQQRYDQAVEMFDTFKHDVRERMVALKQEPLRILAELQITASLFPMLVDDGRQLGNGISGQQPYPLVSQQSERQEAVSASRLDWGSIDGSESMKVSLRELQKNRWIQAARQAGVHSNDVCLCVAALLAGLIPAPRGETTFPTLKAASQVIAYGRVVLVPVSLTALTTLDLFGAIDMHRQMFVPSTGGLADCILQAQLHPDELVLIVLEGIDRVPGMPVYVPLLRQYIEVRQAEGNSAGITPINLFHPRALAPNDPYLELSWFTWPKNVLLAATLDNDLNGLPCPPVCDRWLVRMEPKASAGSSTKSAPTCTGISLEQWQTWEQEIRSETAGSASTLELTDHRQKAFHAALTMLNVTDPDIVVEDAWPRQFQQDAKEAH